MLLDRSNFPRGIVIHGLRVRVLEGKENKRKERKKKEKPGFSFLFSITSCKKTHKKQNLEKTS